MLHRSLIAGLLTLVAFPLVGAAVPSRLRIEYVHKLADFTGTVPFQGVRVRADRARDEAFVLDRGTVRIFGATDMETYSFEIDPQLGTFYDLAVDEAGDIFLLGYDRQSSQDGPAFFLQRCDYRGEPVERIVPQGLPESMRLFSPNSMVYRNGRLYLLSELSFQVAVLDRTGRTLSTLDVAPFFEVEGKQGVSAEIRGFTVDGDGNMYFSVPVQFVVAIVSPGGEVRTFGEPGSRPGKFGLAGPLAVDDAGNIFVGDLLRSVVLVFSRDLEFIREFGGYGLGEKNLIRPSSLAVSPGGKLFVSQMRQAGVSVYRVSAGIEG